MSRRPERTAPWYMRRPWMSTAVAALLFAGVVILQGLDTRASDAIALLYILPIALIAVTWGFWGGLVAALAGYVAFTVFALTDSTGYMDVDGWITRGAAMFLLGGLLGRATQQSVQAQTLALNHQRDRMRLEEENRRYAAGVEISDSILQYVAAAKWRLEQGKTSEAAELLATAMDRGQQMVGDLLPGQLVSTDDDHGPHPVKPVSPSPVPSAQRDDLGVEST